MKRVAQRDFSSHSERPALGEGSRPDGAAAADSRRRHLSRTRATCVTLRSTGRGGFAIFALSNSLAGADLLADGHGSLRSANLPSPFAGKVDVTTNKRIPKVYSGRPFGKPRLSIFPESMSGRLGRNTASESVPFDGRIAVTQGVLPSAILSRTTKEQP